CASSTIVEGAKVTLEAILDGVLGNATVRWTANGAVIEGNSLQIEDENTEPGSKLYVVTVTTPDGCATTLSVRLVILPATLQVPNLFTPNGDERNDLFRVIYTEGLVIEAFELRVYSRWGNLVFETNNIDEGWDGTKDGELMPSDVYVYYYSFKINGQDSTNVEKGNITLLR
ncbi:MAG: gliding motility-associated C-terminal domain-containing protein, partial [Saprospiraceae bacterium]|nr:gliding motility-associated C-terminal domain-containing protein [Saprospiraceae bacterium]